MSKLTRGGQFVVMGIPEKLDKETRSRQLRSDTIGPGTPSCTSGSGKIGAIESGRTSPVNTLGDCDDVVAKKS